MKIYGFLLILFIIVVIIYAVRFSTINENFKDSDLECNNKIQGTIVSTHCNDIPVFPKGLEPKDKIFDESEKQDYQLVPKYNHKLDKPFKFNFKIPELKYDGIYSRVNENGKCKWSCKNIKSKNYYGTNKLSPVPEIPYPNFDGLIIDPPECAGYETGYSPSVYTYNCTEQAPCPSI